MSEEAFHPIIEAMIASANSKDRALALAQKDQTDKEEADNRRKTLKATIQHFDDEHQINMGHLGVAQKQYDLMLKEFRSRAQQQVLSNIKEGSQSVDTLPSAPSIPTALNSQPDDPSQNVTASPASVAPTPQFSQMPQPGPSSSQDGNVDVGGQSMPRAAVAQIPGNVAAVAGNKARAIAEAQDQAKLPNQAARDKAAQDREDARDKSNYDRAMGVARINANSNHDRGELALLARMIAMNGGMGVDPDVASSKYNSILDGQTGYQTLSKQEKAAVDKIAAIRGTSLPTNQPAYSKKLDQASGIQDLLGQARELANNYSSDSPKQPDATTLDTVVKGAQQIPLVGRFVNPGAIPGTDLRSKLDDLKSKGGALASFYDQQNRKSDAEILRQVSGLFDAKSTTKQNLEKIETHRRNLVKTVKGDFAGINPQDVENVLSNRGAHDLLESMNPSGSKPLTSAIAHQLLVESHGDNSAALKLATDRGYDVSKIVQ